VTTPRQRTLDALAIVAEHYAVSNDLEWLK
jgi:hypothetical protein